MGAFATLRIPLAPLGPADAVRACDAAYRSAGTWNPSWDAAGSALSVQMQFPGNITAMAAKIAAAGFDLPALIEITVPLRSIADPDEPSDGVRFLELLASDARIVAPRLTADGVTAQIAPDTYAAHAIFDHCLEVGLMPQDVPTLPSLRGL